MDLIYLLSKETSNNYDTLMKMEFHYVLAIERALERAHKEEQKQMEKEKQNMNMNQPSIPNYKAPPMPPMPKMPSIPH